MFMRANTEAARAIAYVAAGYYDVEHSHPDSAARKQAQAAYEYLVPIVKGWSTEIAIDVASTGVQVHGGMGFIEETGAAQFYRDARILTIYEGTTAIQANDLVGRKTSRDGGATARAFIGQMRASVKELAAGSGDLPAIGQRLSTAVDAYEAVVDYVVAQFKNNIRAVYAGSVPYLKLAGITHGGWQMARAALAANRMAAEGHDVAFATAKIATARFFADHMLVMVPALAATVVAGSAGTLALAEEVF
jgi:3-(methylthio)propanoyl-CoA dehydrogenase